MAHSSSSGTEPWLAETYTKVARISLRPKSPKQYATVFVAKNERSSLLAVKEYHKSALKPENGRRRAEVRNEVELLAAVQNGPHILVAGPVRYFCDRERNIEQPMRLYARNLRDLLNRTGTTRGLVAGFLLIPDWYNTVLIQMLKALEFLHDKTINIIHRDIRPENILFDNLDHFVLAGFRHARRASPPPTDQCRNLEFMAPEMYDKQPQTSAVDIWGLGLVCLDMAGCMPKPPSEDNGTFSMSPQKWYEILDGIPREVEKPEIEAMVRILPYYRTPASELLLFLSISSTTQIGRLRPSEALLALMLKGTLGEAIDDEAASANVDKYLAAWPDTDRLETSEVRPDQVTPLKARTMKLRSISKRATMPIIGSRRLARPSRTTLMLPPPSGSSRMAEPARSAAPSSSGTTLSRTGSPIILHQSRPMPPSIDSQEKKDQIESAAMSQQGISEPVESRAIVVATPAGPGRMAEPASSAIFSSPTTSQRMDDLSDATATVPPTGSRKKGKPDRPAAISRSVLQRIGEPASAVATQNSNQPSKAVQSTPQPGVKTIAPQTTTPIRGRDGLSKNRSARPSSAGREGSSLTLAIHTPTPSAAREESSRAVATQAPNPSAAREGSSRTMAIATPTPSVAREGSSRTVATQTPTPLAAREGSSRTVATQTPKPSAAREGPSTAVSTQTEGRERSSATVATQTPNPSTARQKSSSTAATQTEGREGVARTAARQTLSSSEGTERSSRTMATQPATASEGRKGSSKTVAKIQTLTPSEERDILLRTMATQLSTASEGINRLLRGRAPQTTTNSNQTPGPSDAAATLARIESEVMAGLPSSTSKSNLESGDGKGNEEARLRTADLTSSGTETGGRKKPPKISHPLSADAPPWYPKGHPLHGSVRATQAKERQAIGRAEVGGQQKTDQARQPRADAEAQAQQQAPPARQSPPRRADAQDQRDPKPGRLPQPDDGEAQTQQKEEDKWEIPRYLRRRLSQRAVRPSE